MRDQTFFSWFFRSVHKTITMSSKWKTLILLFFHFLLVLIPAYDLRITNCWFIQYVCTSTGCISTRKLTGVIYKKFLDKKFLLLLIFYLLFFIMYIFLIVIFFCQEKYSFLRTIASNKVDSFLIVHFSISTVSCTASPSETYTLERTTHKIYDECSYIFFFHPLRM